MAWQFGSLRKLLLPINSTGDPPAKKELSLFLLSLVPHQQKYQLNSDGRLITQR